MSSGDRAGWMAAAPDWRLSENSPFVPRDKTSGSCLDHAVGSLGGVFQGRSFFDPPHRAAATWTVDDAHLVLHRLRLDSHFAWARALRAELDDFRRRWAIGAGDPEDLPEYRRELADCLRPKLREVVLHAERTFDAHARRSATAPTARLFLLTSWRFIPLPASTLMRLLQAELEDSTICAFAFLSTHTVMTRDATVDMLVWSGVHAAGVSPAITSFLDALAGRYLTLKTEEMRAVKTAKSHQDPKETFSASRTRSSSPRRPEARLRASPEEARHVEGRRLVSTSSMHDHDLQDRPGPRFRKERRCR